MNAGPLLSWFRSLIFDTQIVPSTKSTTKSILWNAAHKFEMKTIHFNFYYITTIKKKSIILLEFFLKSDWFRNSSTPVTWTLKGNENQFELAGNSSYPISSYRGSTVVSLCQALAQCRRAKKASVQWNSERAMKSINGGKREPVSIFWNTSIRPLPRPLPEKPFLVSKCQNVKRCGVGGVSQARLVCQR